MGTGSVTAVGFAGAIANAYSVFKNPDSSTEDYVSAIAGISGSFSAFSSILTTVGKVGIVTSWDSDLTNWGSAKTNSQLVSAGLGLISDASATVAILGDVTAQPELILPATVISSGASALKTLVDQSQTIQNWLNSGNQAAQAALSQSAISPLAAWSTGDTSPPPASPAGWSISWNSPGILGDPSHPPVQTVEQVLYYDPSSQEFVTASYQHVAASSVTNMSNQSAGIGIQLWTDTNGIPNGSGVSAIQSGGTAILTDIGSGKQVIVAGTVNTSNLQPGQPVPVSTTAGTYHLDPATGIITDPGAITSTVNGNTVTIITQPASDGSTTMPNTFAVIQSDTTSSSSNVLNVLGYPWEPAATAWPRSHGCRRGFSGIIHVRGSGDEDGGAALWGFVRRGGCGDGHRHRRSMDRGRSSGRTVGRVDLAERRFDRITVMESALPTHSGHTRWLPVTNDPGRMVSLGCWTTQDRDHDVSLGFGGLG